MQSFLMCADIGGEVDWDQEDMSVDGEEVPPSHNLQDMPWDGTYGELGAFLWRIGLVGLTRQLHVNVLVAAQLSSD